MCKYRVQVLGFEAEVGAVQESHHHHVEGQGASAPGSNVADCALCDSFCTGLCRLQAQTLAQPMAQPMGHVDHIDHSLGQWHDHGDGQAHFHPHDHGPGDHVHATYPHAAHPLGPLSALKSQKKP